MPQISLTGVKAKDRSVLEALEEIPLPRLFQLLEAACTPE